MKEKFGHMGIRSPVRRLTLVDSLIKKAIGGITMTGLFFISKLPQRLQDAVAFWGQWFKQDLYSLDLKCLDTSDFPPSVIDGAHATIRRALWCFKDPSKRFFSKIIGIIQYVQLLPHIFPGAKLVYIIQDARFAANSMVRLCRLEKEPAGTTCVPMDICLSTKGKVRCGH